MIIGDSKLSLQWDNSVDGLTEDSPNRGSGVRLPSPKRRVVSPLEKYEINNLKKRRKFKRWSTSEEETLRIGVDKYVKLHSGKTLELISILFDGLHIFCEIDSLFGYSIAVFFFSSNLLLGFPACYSIVILALSSQAYFRDDVVAGMEEETGRLF